MTSALHLLSRYAHASWRLLSSTACLMLLCRITLASVAFDSDNYNLLRYEYLLPLVTNKLLALVVIGLGNLFLVMLTLGLCTRWAAVGMLLTTAVMQDMVYPCAWPTQLIWVALLLPLLVHGAGAVSLDRLRSPPGGAV